MDEYRWFLWFLVLYALAVVIPWGAWAIVERDKIRKRLTLFRLQFKQWRSARKFLT